MEHDKGGDKTGRANTDFLARRLGPEGLAIASAWGDELSRSALADLLDELGLAPYASACREAARYEPYLAHNGSYHWYDGSLQWCVHPESDLPSKVYRKLETKLAACEMYHQYDNLGVAVLDLIQAWVKCSKKP